MHRENQAFNKQLKSKVGFTLQSDDDQTTQNQQLPLKSVQNVFDQKKNAKNLQHLQTQEETLTHKQVILRLQKLIKFIQFLNIDPEEIWEGKSQIGINEFANILNQKYSYYLSNWQLSAVLQLSSNKKQLGVKNFTPLGIWQNSQEGSCLLKKTINTASSSKIYKRAAKKEIKSRKLGKEVQNTKQRKKTTNESTYTLDCEEAQHYSKLRKQCKINSLKKDIEESILENKWDFIVMVGEINQWIEAVKKQVEEQPETVNNFPADLSSFRYRVFNRQHIEIVQENINTGQCEQIPQVVFLKRYQNLKKKMVKADSNKNNLKGTVLMVLEDNDKLTKTNLHNRLNQRDQELNYVLLEVMRMKSIFQWQNKLLADANVND